MYVLGALSHHLVPIISTRLCVLWTCAAVHCYNALQCFFFLFWLLFSSMQRSPLQCADAPCNVSLCSAWQTKCSMTTFLLNLHQHDALVWTGHIESNSICHGALSLRWSRLVIQSTFCSWPVIHSVNNCVQPPNNSSEPQYVRLPSAT